MTDIYLYGMILATRSMLLQDDFPQPDSYAEIKESYFAIGGETAIAGAILSSLGAKIALAGSNTGYENDAIIRKYFKDRNVNLSYLRYNENFAGVVDNVIIDKNTRTCFGHFNKLYSSPEHWFEKPDEDAIKSACVVGTDPFFGDEIVAMCKKHGKKYATIDSRHDSEMSKNCEIIAISHEFIDQNYPDINYKELLKLYTDNSDGLIIFTFGENEVMYGRKGQEVKLFKPYSVDVVSTLGAGDSFKAGAIYALYEGMNDDKTVEFACATAASACTKFPIFKNPPTLEKINEIIKSR